MQKLRLLVVCFAMGAIPMMAQAQDPAADPNAGAGAPSAETKWAPEAQHCDDSVDNDGDGMVDCADSDCRAFRACRHEVCDNHFDDDGDGLTDCADDECQGNRACNEALHCLDGVDNDGDGKTDCGDDACKEDAVCTAAADEQKKQEAAAEERRLRPFKIKAATDGLSSAQKDESDARKRIAENPRDEAAQKSLGAAIALQARLRSELIGMGAWASSPKPVANAAPLRVAPAVAAPASAAPASAAPVAVAVCSAPPAPTSAAAQLAPAPPSTAARINFTPP